MIAEVEDALAAHPVMDRKTDPDQGHPLFAGKGVALAVADQ